MTMQEPARVFKAVGLMSGTSLDGVDGVLVETDGGGQVKVLARHYEPYPDEMAYVLRCLAVGDLPLNDVLRVEALLSMAFARVVAALVRKEAEVDVVGVHGQTIRHLPAEGLTWQLGDPNRVSEMVRAETGWEGPVVMDFRRRDIAAGGQGAPLVPLFHQALVGEGVVLNLGGVANVTVCEAGGRVRGVDCGPGMGLLNRLFLERTGHEIDDGGKVTLTGRVDEAVVRRLKDVPFYARPLPRSADRYEFDTLYPLVAGLSLPDAAATLAAVTAEGVRMTLAEMGVDPDELVWCGGGGRNAGVLKALEVAGFGVRSIQDFGLGESDVEAACFAWLAVRRLRGLPTSLPTTTGVSRPVCGGVVA